MKKQVLIRSYEGDFLVTAPKHTKRNDVIEAAREHLNTLAWDINVVTHLNNIEYITQSKFNYDEMEQLKELDRLYYVTI